MLIFGDSTACIKTALDVKCPFMMAFVTSGKLKAELWDFQFTLGHFLRVLFCFRAVLRLEAKTGTLTGNRHLLSPRGVFTGYAYNFGDSA